MDSTVVLYLAGVIVLLLVLFLVGRRSERSMSEIREMVSALVEAAEQMMPGQSGSEKLSFVLARADELGITKYVHPTLLRALIESSVYWLTTRPAGIVERGR